MPTHVGLAGLYQTQVQTQHAKIEYVEVRMDFESCGGEKDYGEIIVFGSVPHTKLA